MQGDPRTCRVFMSKAQYEGYVRRQAQHKMIIGPSSCGGSTECIVDEKEQLAELKHRLDNVVTDICELKVQVQKLKMDYFGTHYFVIVAVCWCSFGMSDEQTLEVNLCICEFVTSCV